MGAPPPKKNKTTVFLGKFPKSVYPPTHHMVFVRFGKTKGDLRVKKGDFRGDFGGFWAGLGISHPPIFGRVFPKIAFFFFFWGGGLP